MNRRESYQRPKIRRSWQVRVIAQLAAEAIAILSLAALFAAVPIAWLSQ